MKKRIELKVGHFPRVFDSGLEFVKPVVFMPIKLQAKLRWVQRQVKDNEFSALARLEVKNESFVLSDDLYIPKQEVSNASVDYLENLDELKRQGWNVVIHSHPFAMGTSSFSYTDETTINAHFPLSLLLNGRSEIVDSSLILYFNEHPVKIKVEVELFFPEEQVDIGNISIKTVSYQWWNSWKEDKNGKL